MDARAGQGKLTRTYTLRWRDTVAAPKPPPVPPDSAGCRCRIPFKLVVIRIDDVGLLARAADGPSPNQLLSGAPHRRRLPAPRVRSAKELQCDYAWQQWRSSPDEVCLRLLCGRQLDELTDRIGSDA